MKKAMNNDITIEFQSFIDFIIESLDDEQMLWLIAEYDENIANWAFVHEGYLLFRRIIRDNKKEYKEYLETMAVYSDEEEQTVINIMDSLEDK